MENEAPTNELFIVRQYDGFDYLWLDVSEPVSKEEANRIFNEYTDNGTKKISYDEIDYYAIFPAETRMRYSYESLMEKITNAPT